MYLNPSLDSVTETDLQTLIDREISEGKQIEYKICLPRDDYEGKREFLADVTSFANAAGGHLLFGIRENEGIPVDICGLTDINPDAEILRLESMIRDNVEPRIHGLSMRTIPLSNSATAIVVHIPNSWSKPHVVKFQKHWRFYSRNSAGKYPLDVGELRSSFLFSEAVGQKIREFRAERLGNITADESPVILGAGAKIVLHIVPPSIAGSPTSFDLGSLTEKQRDRLQPIGTSSSSLRYNYDGIVSHGTGSTESEKRTYLQIFRNGSIEAVNTDLLSGKLADRKIPFIPSPKFELEVGSAVYRFLAIQREMGVTPPLSVMLSLLDVAGYTMVGYSMRYYSRLDIIDKNNLILPDVMIESFEYDMMEVMEIMKPAFDAVWNATGWPRSMNYDETGKWSPRQG